MKKLYVLLVFVLVGTVVTSLAQTRTSQQTPVVEQQDAQENDGFEELDAIMDEADETGEFRVQPLREPSNVEVLARKFGVFLVIQYFSIYGALKNTFNSFTDYVAWMWQSVWPASTTSGN